MSRGGSGERRKGELWNEKNTSSFLRVDKLATSATSKELQYGLSFENKLYGAHAFELIRC